MSLTTTSAVQAEGALVKEQFGLSDDAAFEGLLEERIAEASAEVERLVGAETYGTTDAGIATNLTTAETYLATSKVFQTIVNIAAAWDQEALPTEFIDREELPRIARRYREQAEHLLEPYMLGVGVGARPVLVAASIRRVPGRKC